MDVNIWLPILTLFLGYGLSALGEFIRDQRRARREVMVRELERQRQRVDRREEFEIQTLLNVQEAAHALVRTAEEMFFNLEEGKKDSALEVRNIDALQRLHQVEVRLLHEDLRLLIRDLRRAAAPARDPDNVMEASSLRATMNGTFLEANRVLGERLRGLYGESNQGEKPAQAG